MKTCHNAIDHSPVIGGSRGGGLQQAVSTEAQTLIDNVVAWSRADRRVLAVGLCGSYARGEQRPDSDIDICVLTTNVAALLDDRSWVDVLGERARILGPVEDYNLVQSLRVCYGDLEVEFGITDAEWAEPPIDDGTARVINDGLKILHDPESRLKSAVDYCASRRR